MNVFISWSGQRSHAVAKLLRTWIKCVLQATNPWFSAKDLERGSIWFSEINDQIREANIGIVCLTPENKEAPWIMFESGALLKGLQRNRVVPLLIDLSSADVADPLGQLNHALPTRDGIFALVSTLNVELADKKLDPDVLQGVFDTYWPQFEQSYSEILSSNPAPPASTKVRNEKEILNDVLGYVRNIAKRVDSLEIASQRPRLREYTPRSRDAVGLDRMLADGMDMAKDMINEGCTREDVRNVLVKENFPAILITAILAYHCPSSPDYGEEKNVDTRNPFN